MAFFKPWRSGKDLKSEEQSWDDAFTAHLFGTRQSEIMKYFNVHYECFNARDNYTAQMKKGEYVGIFSNWDVYDNLNDSFHNQNRGEGDDFECNMDVMDNDNIIRPKTEKWNKDMLQVESLLHTAGCFNESPDGLVDFGDLTPLVPTYLQSGKDWKVVVEKKRQELLNERSKYIYEHCNEPNSKAQHQKSLGDVKVVDKSYVTKSFKAGIERKQHFIDNTVHEYFEQERAF